MALQTDWIEASGLNINADPHPAGIYDRVLTRAASFVVQARGSDYAKITKPARHSTRHTILFGRILVWTDLDLKGRWLDLNNDDELSAALKSKIQIPDNAKPNFRTFDYVFDETKHQLWFEGRNVLRQTLGPSTAKRIFQTLTMPDLLGPTYPAVQVSVIPEEGALERILSMPGLQTLVIRVNLPNADYASPEARRRVFGKLDGANSDQLDLTLRKKPGAARLEVKEEFEDFARVGADTGFTRGEEKGEDGKPQRLSTVDLPRRLYLPSSLGEDFLTRVRAKLRL